MMVYSFIARLCVCCVLVLKRWLNLTWDRDKVSLQLELLANWGIGGSKLTFTSAA